MSEQQMLSREEISTAIARRAWEDEDFRSRVLSNPNAVFEEETKQKLPAGVKLKVIEDTADTIHFVIPAKPTNADELSDSELEAVAGGTSPAIAVPIAVAGMGLLGVIIPKLSGPINSGGKKW